MKASAMAMRRRITVARHEFYLKVKDGRETIQRALSVAGYHALFIKARDNAIHIAKMRLLTFVGFVLFSAMHPCLRVSLCYCRIVCY